MDTKLSSEETEDLTGIAGWVYTDLMLALMVIFLATISFVPQFVDSSTQKANQNYSYSKVLSTSLNVIYEDFNLGQIKSDILKFKDSNGIPQDAVIVYAQFVGGYSNSESSATAIARALKFSQQLDSADKQLLQNSATTLSSSNVLTSNQVIARFTFAVTSKLNK
jgi:hypothetical protein